MDPVELHRIRQIIDLTERITPLCVPDHVKDRLFALAYEIAAPHLDETSAVQTVSVSPVEIATEHLTTYLDESVLVVPGVACRTERRIAIVRYIVEHGPATSNDLMNEDGFGSYSSVQYELAHLYGEGVLYRYRIGMPRRKQGKGVVQFAYGLQKDTTEESLPDSVLRYIRTHGPATAHTMAYSREVCEAAEVHIAVAAEHLRVRDVLERGERDANYFHAQIYRLKEAA
jgi:hypothetical protein